jgi:hypothetical protein
MSDLTRRGFVTKSAGSAAAMTAIGAIVTGQAEAERNASVSRETVVAFVRDPRNGEISVMSADRQVTIHDRKLAAQIARAVS